MAMSLLPDINEMSDDDDGGAPPKTPDQPTKKPAGSETKPKPGAKVATKATAKPKPGAKVATKAASKPKPEPKAKPKAGKGGGKKRPAAAVAGDAEPAPPAAPETEVASEAVLKRPAAKAPKAPKVKRAYKYMYHAKGMWGIKWEGREVLTVSTWVFFPQLRKANLKFFSPTA